MKIIIKTLSGSTLEIEVQTTETVLNIKQKIEQLKQFEIDQQKILRKGTLLQNESTIGELGLVEKDLLVVMVNVKKGPPQQQPAQQYVQQPPQQPQPFQAQQPMQVPKPHISPVSEYLVADSKYDIAFKQLIQKGFTKSECQADMNAQLQQRNPQQYQKIQQNPLSLNQLLQGDAQGEEKEIETDITQKEKLQLNSLILMGFTKEDALEGFLACDKNVLIAASYLVQKLAKGELLSQKYKSEENNLKNYHDEGKEDDDQYY